MKYKVAFVSSESVFANVAAALEIASYINHQSANAGKAKIIKPIKYQSEAADSIGRVRECGVARHADA